MHDETKTKLFSSIPGIHCGSINTMCVYFIIHRSPIEVGINDYGMLFYKIDENFNGGWKLLTLDQLIRRKLLTL